MSLKNGLLGTLLFVVISCGQSKKETPTTTPANNVTNTDSVMHATSAQSSSHIKPSFFKATDLNAGWNLDLMEDRMRLSFNSEQFSFPLPELIRAADANVKLYRAQTESSQIEVQIRMSACNQNPQKSYPYSVTINFKKNTDPEFTTFEGCGAYITDYRLHDIWVLERLNDTLITAEDFTKERPNLEINSTKNTFLGYAGCNTMRGTLFSERNLLRFKNIAITRKMCPPNNKEAAFIKALEASTQYKIENRRLYLSNPDRSTLTFLKVD